MSRGAKPGERRGGRTSGTPNKDKAILRDMVNAAFPDWDPVLAMAKIATTTTDPAVELQACKEVAQYIHPKLKSIEHKGEVKERITIVDWDGIRNPEDSSA
jgi:hypothetical protein